MAYNSLSVLGQRPYLTGNTFIKKKEEEESSSSSRGAQEPENSPKQDIDTSRRSDAYQKLLDSKAAEKNAEVSRNANLRNSTVNIAQILKDFRSTAKAIGAPEELAKEVDMYLQLVEATVKKENPDTKLVRSNLLNGATILDEFITQTLQRPSNVVENWIKALFLQKINYAFNEEEINANFLVKFPKKKGVDDDEEVSDDESEDGETEVSSSKENKYSTAPRDEKLKKLFLKANKYSCPRDYKKAMEIFKEALNRAIEVTDRNTESKILYEIGNIYDKNDYLAQALTSYNRSSMVTRDFGVKTKAHYSMAQIYDDVSQFESAINHYMTAISYAGETENLDAQSTSLTKIGNIYSDKYDDTAFDFLLEAGDLVKKSKNNKTKGFVCGNIANAYNKFNEPQDALKYYSHAVKEYNSADMPERVAVNYQRAAELMKDFKKRDKAKRLMEKALESARKTEDVALMKEIHNALGKM